MNTGATSGDPVKMGQADAGLLADFLREKSHVEKYRQVFFLHTQENRPQPVKLTLPEKSPQKFFVPEGIPAGRHGETDSAPAEIFKNEKAPLPVGKKQLPVLRAAEGRGVIGTVRHDPVCI